MNKLLKTVAVLLAASVAFAVAGCKKNDEKKEQLTVIHYRVEDSEFYDWMVEEFEKEYNCDVVYDAVPTANWSDIIEGRLRSDSVDVFGTYPGSVYRDDKYISFMLDLSDMDFVKRLTDEYVDYATYTDGKVYNAPLNLVNDTVFYNKDVFDALGLEEPTNYDEFIAVCDALKAKSSDFGHSGNVYGGAELRAPIISGTAETWPISMVLNSIEAPIVRPVDPWFYVDVWKNGTKSLDDGAIKEVFEKYKKISSYFQQLSFSLSYSRVPSQFALGQYGMLIDGSWSYSQILAVEPEFEIGVFPLPSNNSSEYKDYAVAKPGSGFAIHKNSKHIDLAKKFIEFHYRSDVYSRFLKEVTMGSVLKDVKNDASDPVIAELYNSEYHYLSPLSEYIPSIMSYPHSICEKLALNPDYTADNAVNDFVAEFNLSRPQLNESLMERWMGLYNKGYEK